MSTRSINLEEKWIIENEFFHNIFGNMVSSVANYISTELIPRTKDVVIGPPRKAVEHIRQRKNLAGENWSPKLPFLVISPNIDIAPSEQYGGNFLYNYPIYNSRLAQKLYDPVIYDDGTSKIVPVLNRYESTIDFNFFCSSYYEAIDIRHMITSNFGGLNRPIYPVVLNCLMMIPDEFVNYTYKNYYTGDTYSLDWTSNSNETSYVIIRNINQNKLTFPCSVRPYFKLDNIAASVDQGSGDILSEYRVSGTITWYASLPSHYILISKMFPDIKIQLEFKYATDMTYVPVADPSLDTGEYLRVMEYAHDVSIADSTSTSEIINIKYDGYENYLLTFQDINDIQEKKNITIDITDKNIPDERYLEVYAKYGKLEKYTHYSVENNVITLYGLNMSLMRKNDIIIIVYYKDIFD